MRGDQLSPNFMTMGISFATGGKTIGSAAPMLAPLSSPGSQTASADSFAEVLNNAVRHVDELQQAANKKMAAVDSGSSDDLIGAMLASQEASLSFSMLLQVRNKVAGALDDILKMPL